MRITLAQLEALVWVARLGSVQEAARQLHLTQPTISLRLRDLNRAVGKNLFEHAGRRLRLTVEGRAILDHANAVLDEVDRIRQRGAQGKASGLLRLGVSEAVALAGVPTMMKELAQAHPDLRLELSVGTSINLERDLHLGMIDLALSVNLHPDPRIEVLDLGVQEATWVAPVEFRLPAVVTPAQIGHLPILTNPEPSPMYFQTFKWFATAGIVPHKISVSNTLAVIAELVAAGIGLAILPSRLVEENEHRSMITRLESAPPLEAAHVCAAYRVNDRRPAIAAVLEKARQVLDRMGWFNGR